MSEADVNLIHDEDVLRRMWQQTEDFGRKKEIRAHMYRLREERLRNLYSPEPTPAKGCEFSSAQAHVDSFADQTFQSMKSKEVRDAGSPPKEFNYRGQDLKELSNAGWNVESEDKTTDDGRTHVKSVNANIEGRYDVEGGKGQFAAVDRQHQAVTEYQDANTKMCRDESSSNTAAHEHVVRKTDDGSRFSSTTSSSNTSSKIQQVSSTVHETPAIHDYDQTTHDTNCNEKITKITNTEQNLRSNNSQNGELISRKIDYPDDNTKVIVETRCLPDGTRVTSTRREFRAPAQSTHAEYQTRSESKSHSSQQKSDTRESTSKIIRHMSDSRSNNNIKESKTILHTTDSRTDDIVDSQRYVDDNDFKRQLREYTVDDDTILETHRSIRRHDNKTKNVTDHSKSEEDCSQTSYETRVSNKVIDRSTNVKGDYSRVQQHTNQRFAENVDQTDRREVIETFDDRKISQKDVKETHRVTNERSFNVTGEPGCTPRGSGEPVYNVSRATNEPSQNIPRDVDEPNRHSPNVSSEPIQIVLTSKITDERTHEIISDTKVEENFERKKSSDHYQTTYQSDFQQKKVSSDWSPTHQAWASTLRADTPSTTRPSTRASSPGSKTFKSSTSSLRSSVSPDKTSRKPSSRGGSPSKVDRSSPTRSVTSDRYSSTYSTHSVTEVKTNKHKSPERKPPTGRSPAGHSPERKPLDNYRPRPSLSPEKRPPSFTRPSASPERKPLQKTYTDSFPRNVSPTRAAGLPSGPRQSPERKPYQPSEEKLCPDTGNSSLTAPHRSSISPEKPTIDSFKPVFPRSSPSPDRKTTEGFKPATSPDREVSHGKPTPSREPQDLKKRPSASPDRKPGYMRPTAASQPVPDTRRPSKLEDKPDSESPLTPSQSPDRNYSKTVTQVKQDHYKLIDEETKMNTRSYKTHSLPSDKAPDTIRKSPAKDSPDFNESPLHKGRSPSPQKKTVIVTENDELYGRIKKSVELVDITTTHDKQAKYIYVGKRTPTDTAVDKDVPNRESSPTKFGTYDKKKLRDVTETTEITTMTSKKNVDDSLNRLDKTCSKKALEPTSPTKKTPRNSTSPVKSPSRDTKYKHTTDFISTEKNTEEINKKTVSKESPRQLKTPSSSPTRKPQVETEPSTGQSSPTTSVSGFVYFGSPNTERPIVTDLDEEFEPAAVYPDGSQYTRPESLDLTRSTSPSKIPCRSPSPDKRQSPTKECLPRKSSLKKPSNFVNPASPMDKPPSSFRVSPTEDQPDQDITGHKVVKKNLHGEPETSSQVKVKPPLTRRETYDDRCRLILGMINTTTTENVTKETKIPKKLESNNSSPGVSLCDSPIPQELAPFSDSLTQEKTVNTKTDVTDFIAQEQEAIIMTTKTHEAKPRDSSPTKLQDIIFKTMAETEINNYPQLKEKDAATVENKHQLPRQSPEKNIRRPSESPQRQVKSKETNDKLTSKVPQTVTSDINPRDSSPNKCSPLSVSPERKQTTTSARKSPEKQQSEKRPKEKSPTRIITTTNVKFDTKSTSEDTQEDCTKTLIEKSRIRVLESPTRQTSSTTLVHPSSESSSRPHSFGGSPDRDLKTPSRILESQLHRDIQKNSEDQNPVKKSPSKPRESPEKTSDCMKTTATISTSSTFSKTEENRKIITSTIDTNHKTSKSTSSSPTRKTSLNEVARSVSPSKPSQPSTAAPKNARSPERKTTKDIPLKSTSPKDSSPRELPRYMKTTASNITKNNITITENVGDTNTSKTIDRKHTASRTLVSPDESTSRTTSPTKFTRQPSVTSSPKKSDTSPDRKPAVKHPSSPTNDDVAKRPKATMSTDWSSAQPATNITPGYMKTTTSVSSKYETDVCDITTEDTQETIISETTESKYPTSRKSPIRQSRSPIDKSSPDYPRFGSPSKPTEDTYKKTDSSPERKPQSQQPSQDIPKKKALVKYPEESSLTCETTGHKNTTTYVSEFDTISTTEAVEAPITSPVQKKYSSEKPRQLSPVKDSPGKIPQDKSIKKSSLNRPSVSPDRKPSYMKPTASVTSKHDTTKITKDIHVTETLATVEHKHQSPTRQPKMAPKDTLLSKPEEPRQLRTPSPTKKTSQVTEVSTDFLMSEREQEILDRVHKSLRKLSPERKEKSPSRERSPNKTTTSLFDLDLTTESVETHEFETEDLGETLEKHIINKSDFTRREKSQDLKDQKISSKPSSRNVSPIKRVPSVPTHQNPESPTKSRSISPRKPLTQTDRPQSPHGVKNSGFRSKDHAPFNRKPTPATLSTYRIEKFPADIKKPNGVTKPNVSKITTTSKSTPSRLISSQATKPNEPETRRIPTPKGLKENNSPRKETVTRTSSDSNIKPKKTSPQRMKSKPEIQVNDLSTKSPKYQKPVIKEPHSKLPAKPKSATALNTSTDDDDIIIDVQQSKSSRENSPDRICPTPVNLTDDVGTPRFPDEVSEPDDEYRRRTYHTIHETESVVDDIVEICEDEELFVKKADDSYLSVNDKVSKFTTKIESLTKPKDTTTIFKDTEKRVHSDFIDESIKSDECLLSVSEKVNKFAKSPRDTKDNRSPSRKITDEYDKNTIYQDDYTKLSVNDKAHLFVETAENIKLPKVKLAQKVDRPDLSNVDDSLKKDDCLLSVSDKVNKFVKTAENFFLESQEVDQKDQKIKEQHEKIVKQIVNEDDSDEANETNECSNTTTINNILDECEHNTKSYNKEARPQPQNKGYSSSPKSKTTERTPTVKITTLRSSEAVKKAKALFENIASTQKTKDVTQTTAKTTKLTDIGVVKKSPITDSTIVLHPSIEDVSPYITEVDSELDTAIQVPRTTERPTTGTHNRLNHPHVDEKPRASPNRLTARSPEVPRTKSPMRQSVETTTTKTVSSKYPLPRAESPRYRPESPRHRPDSDKQDKVPGYLKPTKTSQMKEDTKSVDESEVSSRRGSGKFGVELRRTSIERSTISSERRRSVEHHQPCIEDIFDLDLLEQMLEKVVGYEQRRRIRSQIRVVKNDTEHVEIHIHTKIKQNTSTSNPKAPEPHSAKSPERVPKSTHQRTLSPARHSKTPQKMQPERSHPKEPSAPVLNGHAKEPGKTTTTSRLRPHSPEKPALNSIRSAKSPTRQPSPVKKRTASPTKTTSKSKSNRFNEYASAYMKKVGLNESDKLKFAEKRTKKVTESRKTVSHETQERTSQEFTTTKNFTATSERTSSRDVIEFVQVNGKRSPSPEKITSILRKPQSPERDVYSPVSKTISPERRDYSPLSKTTTPKAHSPERKVHSPVGKTYVPECKIYSPINKAPERKFQSPEHKEHSPERRVYSPVSKVPERKAQSPERRVYSPDSKAPERKAQSPDRKAQSPDRKRQSIERKPKSPERNNKSPTDRLYQRSPSPEFKRQKSDARQETAVKTVYNIEKKIKHPDPASSTKPVQEDKPSWVTNRNLKKITSETRTFSSKKMETEKPKYRASSPSKVISKPIDVITSSYGPGPLDADGRPLFGIKALRNGATNFQVKGTVIRQEFHSHNGGEPEGTVSVTAYSSQPEELEQLLASQGVEPPSRIHGLSAITTTKKFGGETGISMSSVNTKEERASLEHFTHTNRKMDSQVDDLETVSFDTREEIADTRRIDSQTNQTVKSDRSDRRREESVTEVRKGQKEERREKVERREDKKAIRQSSVKSLTEKFIKSANDSGKSDRSSYPKAGLILRTSSAARDSVSGDEAHPGLARTDSENSIGSVDDVVVTTSTDRGGAVTTTTRTTRHHGPTTTHQRTSTVTHHEPIVTTKKTTTVITGSQEPVVTRVVTQGPVVTKTVTGQRQGMTERSFLDSNTKVTGVQDILTRMKNADIVVEAGDSASDSEARALLNKFLGASVLMAGMQSYVTDQQPPQHLAPDQETVRTSSGKVTSTRVEDIDLDQCWDERLLRKLLDECTDYEQRRRLRARIRSLMAEQEACAAAVTDALGAAHITSEAEGVSAGGGDPREEEEVTVTSSVRRDSSEKTSSSSTTKTSKVIESVSRSAPKPVSPFAKFRQLEKQNSTTSPSDICGYE